MEAAMKFVCNTCRVFGSLAAQNLPGGLAPALQNVPEVGFEPTRTLHPADLKSAPLDLSGTQAKGKCRVARLPQGLVARSNLLTSTYLRLKMRVSREGLEPPIF